MKILSKVLGLDNDLLFSTFQYYSFVFVYGYLVFSVCVLNNPWIIVHFIFALIPLMDYYIPIDIRNPTKEEAKYLKRNPLFKLPLYVTLVAEWIMLFWGIRYITVNDLGLLKKFSMIFLLGSVQGNSFNLAHEILHKNSVFEKTVAALHLTKNLQTRFIIEHTKGHHINVATPKDPATALFNESFYKFFPRTNIGSFIDAWGIENKRCKELYGSWLSPYNIMIYFTLNDIFLPFVVWYFFSLEVAVYFTLTAWISIVYLEAINYLEHYGLMRKEVSPGKYEPVNITHSWNAPHRISNYFLFKLQRHSDHHENPLKPYQILCSFDDSPTLPQGYSVCLAMSVIPSTWFNVMNPITEKYTKGEKPDNELMKLTNEKILSFIYKANYIFLGLILIQYLLDFYDLDIKI